MAQGNTKEVLQQLRLLALQSNAHTSGYLLELIEYLAELEKIRNSAK